MGRTRSELESDLGRQLERLLQRNASLAALRPDTTSDITVRTLLRLIETHGPVRSSALAELACLSRPSVSRHLGALLNEGFVSADPDPDDGRAYLIALTDAGRDRLRYVDSALRGRMHNATTDFSAGDVGTLVGMLSRLNDRLDLIPPPGATRTAGRSITQHVRSESS